MLKSLKHVDPQVVPKSQMPTEDHFLKVIAASGKLETQQRAVGFRGLRVNPQASQSAATSKTDGQLCNQINKLPIWQ
jgi:hypothetical protein